MYCSSKTLKQCNPYARWTDNIIFVMFLVQDQSFYELSFRDSMFCYQKCQDSTFWGLNIMGFYNRDSAFRDWKFWDFTFRNSTFQNSIFSDLYFEIQFNIQGFIISGFDVLGLFMDSTSDVSSHGVLRLDVSILKISRFNIFLIRLDVLIFRFFGLGIWNIFTPDITF